MTFPAGAMKSNNFRACYESTCHHGFIIVPYKCTLRCVCVFCIVIVFTGKITDVFTGANVNVLVKHISYILKPTCRLSELNRFVYFETNVFYLRYYRFQSILRICFCFFSL